MQKEEENIAEYLKLEFIVIDDDHINNIICHRLIDVVMPGTKVITFTDPRAGLGYILSRYSDAGINNVVLLLDINMPILSSWEILDKIKNLRGNLAEHINIYILSSSLDPSDKAKAEKHPLIKGYIVKPLSELKIRQLISDLSSQRQ